MKVRRLKETRITQPVYKQSVRSMFRGRECCQFADAGHSFIDLTIVKLQLIGKDCGSAAARACVQPVEDADIALEMGAAVRHRARSSAWEPIAEHAPLELHDGDLLENLLDRDDLSLAAAG